MLCAIFKPRATYDYRQRIPNIRKSIYSANLRRRHRPGIATQMQRRKYTAFYEIKKVSTVSPAHHSC